MQMQAAILWRQGEPLVVESVDLAPPQAGEALVKVKAAGVCHSDLHPARGDWPIETPVVLGHEGAGVVEEIGPGVERLRPGDHIIFCWAPACGACQSCVAGRPVLCDRLERTTYRNRMPSGGTRLRSNGQEVYHFISTACFAEYAVVAEEGAIPVPPEVPFDVLATVGCAVMTGVGAVIRAARVEAGSRVAIIGCGGVGLNMVQGAAIVGCERIIAVDVNAAKLEIATIFGATHTVDSSKTDPVAAIRELTQGRGADYVFDSVGLPTTVAQSLQATGKGGTVVLTGLARFDTLASIPTFPFVMQEKRLIGSVYGSGQPQIDIPRLVALYQAGKLKLRELVSRGFSLAEVNTALATLEHGEVARGIILF